MDVDDAIVKMMLMTKDYFGPRLISLRLSSLCSRYSSVWTDVGRDVVDGDELTLESLLIDL